jgi:hypothetical protein
MIRTSDTQPRTRQRRAPRRFAPWFRSWSGHVSGLTWRLSGLAWRLSGETWRRLAREITLIATFAVIYEEISANLVQGGGPASSHALLIVSAEKALGIFHEQAVQTAVIGNDPVTDTLNAYYGGTHFLIPLLVLGWLFFRYPAHYGRARSALAASTGLAFIVFWLFPVAPPRLLPARFNIVDMLTTPDGSGHFETSLINAAGDKYASMPSLHVAWAVWCALAVYPVARHWALRALADASPLMTTYVVVATGNHFFLDAAAGALLACTTWAAVTRVGPWFSARAATRGGPGAEARLRHRLQPRSVCRARTAARARR